MADKTHLIGGDHAVAWLAGSAQAGDGSTVILEKEASMNEALNGTIQDPPAIAEHEVLTVQEVAQFLRVPRSTIYKLARIGHIPASKVGKHWRFTRRGLDEWVQRVPGIR